MMCRVYLRNIIVAMIMASILPVISTQASEKLIWHWFSSCEAGREIKLKVMLKDSEIFSTNFPICHMRRSEKNKLVEQEKNQKILEFYIDNAKGFFKKLHRNTSVEVNFWEAGSDSDAVVLGVTFVAENKVIVHSYHYIFPDREYMTEYGPIVVITNPVMLDK